MLSIGKKYRVDEVPEETFAELAAICNEDGTKHIDLIDGVYYIKANEPPSEKETLEQEKYELELWLRQHDYIGVKIATGRATIEEYSDVIAEMQEKAERINEIDAELARLEKNIK